MGWGLLLLASSILVGILKFNHSQPKLIMRLIVDLVVGLRMPRTTMDCTKEIRHISCCSCAGQYGSGSPSGILHIWTQMVLEMSFVRTSVRLFSSLDWECVTSRGFFGPSLDGSFPWGSLLSSCLPGLNADPSRFQVTLTGVFKRNLGRLRIVDLLRAYEC